jgi:ubiquinone/menaquinone biosynthesis C-methylase UbiE
MARVMVEQAFEQPLTEEGYAAIAARLDPCLAMRGGTWRRSSIADDKLRMVCEFDAPDAESVCAAFQMSGVPFERVWSADVYAKEEVALSKVDVAAAPPHRSVAERTRERPHENDVETTDAATNESAAEAWNGFLFEKFARFRRVLTTGFTPHSSAAMHRHPVAEGARILDIGCGFGDMTVALARAAGPTGGAWGVDIADRFVEASRLDAAKARVGNVRFVCADVQTDPLGGPYDAAYSRFGTMFFTDPVAAMRNVKGVLREGGVFCMVVWRRREDNPWIHVAERIVREVVPTLEDPGETSSGPGPFSMASADWTSDILGRAGFRRVLFERHDAPVCIGRDVDEAVDFAMTIGPAGELLRLAGADGAKRLPAVVNALRRALAVYMTAGGVVMPSSSWIVTAR